MISATKDAPHSPPPTGDGPDSARLVGRDGLVASLDRAAALKVAIVSAPAWQREDLAPAGLGRRPARPGACCTPRGRVRHEEQDAQVFWLGLLGAVRQVCGPGGDEPPTPMPEFDGPEMVDRVPPSSPVPATASRW